MAFGAAVQSGNGSAEFATTRWSLIFSGRISDGDQSDSALAELCQIYWRPVFSFICRGGHAAAEAQDLTQEFFLRILHGKILDYADPARGRFRCFLLKSLKNFLIDADIKARRHKRGGGIQFISLEQWMAEAPSRLTLPAGVVDSCSAEAVFDLRWAASVAEEALRQLRMQCESNGHRRVYDVLNEYLTADRGSISYQRLSTMLGISTGSVKRLMHEFRTQYRSLLREAVAETIANPADVDDEVRYLCAALSAALS